MVDGGAERCVFGYNYRPSFGSERALLELPSAARGLPTGTAADARCPMFTFAVGS